MTWMTGSAPTRSTLVSDQLRDYRNLFRWRIPAVGTFSAVHGGGRLRLRSGYRGLAHDRDAKLATLIHPVSSRKTSRSGRCTLISVGVRRRRSHGGSLCGAWQCVCDHRGDRLRQMPVAECALRTGRSGHKDRFEGASPKSFGLPLSAYRRSPPWTTSSAPTPFKPLPGTRMHGQPALHYPPSRYKLTRTGDT